MTTNSDNRRESDRVPMGVECALPWIPVPSSQRPRSAKTSVARKVLFAVAVVILLVGAWQLGRGLYVLAGGPLRYVIFADASDRSG
ncbi:MAG TPA: hypothetical protein VIW78_11445 [Burkholderiales bacterium]